MHQVVEIDKTPAAEPPPSLADQKLLGTGPAEKWLRRSFVLIRWVVRAILISAWASYIHGNFKRLVSSWVALSVSLLLFSLLLYACSLFYLRCFARRALASVSLNKYLALFNLLWSFLLLLTGFASIFLRPVEAEDNHNLPSLLTLFFYPHIVIAHFFTHLLTRARSIRQQLSQSNPSDHEAKEPPPKPASICAVFLQFLLLILWLLYPIARILNSDYLKSPYVFTFFILSTPIATVSFIVFFCTAIALVFYEHEVFPTLL